mgnify:CR=1 FL=1
MRQLVALCDRAVVLDDVLGVLVHVDLLERGLDRVALHRLEVEGQRRNRVREQLSRPVFKRIGIDDAVKYLSYDAVREIDEFFDKLSAGATSFKVPEAS